MSSNGKAYGPGHPHPFSLLRTELVWEGKYDDYGNRPEVDSAGLAMPMQKIVTIDQPRSEAAPALHRSSVRRGSRFQQNLVVWINGLRVLMEAGQ